MTEVRESLVESYLQYANGHEPDSQMKPDQEALSEHFIENGDIRELAASVIKADSFLYRLDR